MTIIDPGHHYILNHLDGDSVGELRFVKREGPGFPGNVGHYEGTNLQEVLRACIDRIKYLDDQISSDYNYHAINHLRCVIEDLETRAAKRHGLDVDKVWRLCENTDAELLPTCKHCGHIVCSQFI